MTNIEILENYYAAFNRQDWEGMLNLLDENVMHEPNEGAAVQGREKFRGFLARMDEHYSEQVEELCLFQGADEHRLAAEFFIKGRYLKTDGDLPEATGQDYRLRVGAFFEIRDGKITRVTNYYNLEHWTQLISV